jgi:hypothetical protein
MNRRDPLTTCRDAALIDAMRTRLRSWEEADWDADPEVVHDLRRAAVSGSYILAAAVVTTLRSSPDRGVAAIEIDAAHAEKVRVAF